MSSTESSSNSNANTNSNLGPWSGTGSNTSATTTVSQPSSILFFIAVAIGILIALIFVFFSIRYYVRSRMGLFATARITTLDNGVVIISNDYPSQTHSAYTQDAFDALRTQRRRRRRYLKKRRLTEEEVSHLFPVRTYQVWLDGGAEIDAQNREILTELKEENDEEVQVDEAEHQAHEEAQNGNSSSNDENHDSHSSSSSHNNQKEVDLSNPFQAEMHFDSGTCAICIDTFEPEDQVRGLICGHVFHQECLDPWLIKRKACCPMCKRDYYMKNQNQNQEGNDNNGNEENPNGDNDSLTFPEVHYTTVAERVAEILTNHPELQGQAENKIKKYMSMPYRIFWSLMGISTHDLLNSAILELDYELSQREQQEQQQQQQQQEQGQQQNQPEQPEIEATENEQLPAHSSQQTNTVPEGNITDSQEARYRIAAVMV